MKNKNKQQNGQKIKVIYNTVVETPIVRRNNIHISDNADFAGLAFISGAKTPA